MQRLSSNTIACAYVVLVGVALVVVPVSRHVTGARKDVRPTTWHGGVLAKDESSATAERRMTVYRNGETKANPKRKTTQTCYRLVTNDSRFITSPSFFWFDKSCDRPKLLPFVPLNLLRSVPPSTATTSGVRACVAAPYSCPALEKDRHSNTRTHARARTRVQRSRLTEAYFGACIG